jgi:hypothetical protein
MEQKLIKVFQKAKYEPGANLAENVWLAIVLREKRIARFKLWAFSIMGIVSLAGLIPAFNILLSDLAQSSFYEYFSLLFGGGGAVFSYWKELTLSLAESLPSASIIFVLSLIFIFFLSLRYAVKQINKNHLMGGSAVLSV